MPIKKVLILHVSNVLGGAERSLLDLLWGFGNSEKNYILVLDPETDIYDKAVSAGYVVFPMPVKYFTRTGFRSNNFLLTINMLRTSFRLYRLCKKENVQTVYCNTHRALIYMFFVKWTPIKIICSCRDNLRSRWERLLLRFFNPHAIAVSAHIRKQLDFLSHTSWLHNGVRVPEVNQKSGKDAIQVFSIGYIAHTVPWKNQRDFIRMAEQVVRSIPESRFYIIGEVVHEDYYQELQGQIHRAGLRSHIILTGQVEPIGDYLNVMDIIVHTAIDEPFGRAIVEAMQLGKPVIAYACGGSEELIEDGVTGFLVRPYDVHQVARIAVELIRHPNRKEQIGFQAQVYAQHTFDVRKYARRMQQLFLNG